MRLSSGNEPADAVARRFSILLTSDEERLVHHLRQSVAQLTSHGIAIDFVRLLDDLRHWDHPDRYVQRNWARQFWAPPTTTNDSEDQT